MAPFYGWGSTASRLVPLRGGSLLFTTRFPDISGTHCIDLGRMKGWVDLGATQWFWTRDPEWRSFFRFFDQVYHEILGICFKFRTSVAWVVLAFLQTNVAADPTLTFSTANKLFTSVKSSLNILPTVSFLAKTWGLTNLSIRDTRSSFNFLNKNTARGRSA